MIFVNVKDAHFQANFEELLGRGKMDMAQVSQIVGGIIDAIKKQNIDNAIVKIIYHVPENKRDNVDLLAVQRACSAASYIVGIIPVHKPITRERRTELRVDMDFKSLLEKYFDSRKDCTDKKDRLIMQAMELYQQIEDQK